MLPFEQKRKPRKHKDNGKRITKYAYGNTRGEVAIKLSKLTNAVFENGYSAVAPKDVYMLYALTTLTFCSHVISQTVYKDTANTLSRVYAGLTQKKRTDKSCDDSSVQGYDVA